MDGNNNIISITICGDGGCGKSSLALRIVKGEWTAEYDPTIEDSYSVTHVVDGIPYQLQIQDLAGQLEYRNLLDPHSLKHSETDAFLLVYDITSRASLETLTTYYAPQLMSSNEGRGYRRAIPPVKMVVGNKCDLATAKRQVGAQFGLEWARERGCGFMETSARDMVNVEETFMLIVRRVVEARKAHAARTRPEGIQLDPPSQIRTTPATRPSPPPMIATQPSQILNEKMSEKGADSGGWDDDGEGEKKGFFARLLCW